MSFDLETIRSQFPALADTDNGEDRIYFDNPAGTQVPARVVDRMADCMLHANANLGGKFRTSDLADAIVAEAHAAMADFLNAESPDEIIFGQNMTTITLHVSARLAELSRQAMRSSCREWITMRMFSRGFYWRAIWT